MPEETKPGIPPAPGRLPIKLILPNQGRERLAPTGGRAGEPFRPVDDDYRKRLRTQVHAVRQMVALRPPRSRVAPMRVRLLPQASAKTHRPERLFSRQSCPIIGAGRLGEIFVKATVRGLDRLAHEIARNASTLVVKELSSIEVIEPVTYADRRRGRASLEILKESPRGEKGFITRVRLFDFGDEADQRAVLDDFFATCEDRGLEVSRGGYSPKSFLYAVECANVGDVDALSRSIGVRSISHMPVMRSLRPRAFNIEPLPPALPRNGEADGDFPVVVVVDSGISRQDPALSSWVVGRDSYVSPQYRNADHGTFVAGLICWGPHLNPNLPHISSHPCGVYDLQVIPNLDPSRGETDDLTESEFLQTLDSALQQNANRFKVWNLSLGTDEPCSLDEFSPLAEQLDNLQEKYQVSFVISAGNYDSPHFSTTREPGLSSRLAGSRRPPTACSASPWAPSPT